MKTKTPVTTDIPEGERQSGHVSSDGLAGRVRADMRAHGPGAKAGLPVAWYAVPAISPIKRLPDTFPEDGDLCGPLQIVAAQNEFEPASFVVFSFQCFEQVTLTASALKGSAGTMPSASIDLKIVKCWYQGGTAWHSYFADTAGRQLVPELLLNDETLIHVDDTTRDNYVRSDRTDGSARVWISNPMSVDVPFNSETEPVGDADTIRPFRLEANAFKQFWVTVRPPAGTAPGIYKGTLKLSGAGEKPVVIPLSIRVLPFELPKPATYYDLGREFHTMLYNDPDYAGILKANGGDREHADRKMRALYSNMRDHNVHHPQFPDFKAENREAFIRQLELLKETGLATRPLFGGIPAVPTRDWAGSVDGVSLAEQSLPKELTDPVDESHAIVKRVLGHSDVYCFGWDEPARRILIAERKLWQYIHDKGLKIYSTVTDAHLESSGYNEDFANFPGEVTRERAARWHALGQRITNYAAPHTGPENPDFMRRVHGLQLYKANYDGIGNYILTCRGWNDFLGDVHNFRGFNMTYPTRDGVIDTLAWEGIREAVDDIRYATLLKTMAARAIANGTREASYAGRQALQWLEMVDVESADLNTVRLEMIDRILGLHAYADFPKCEERAKPVKASDVRKAAATSTGTLPVPTPEETVLASRRIMARSDVDVAAYTEATFTMIQALAAGGRTAQARVAAELTGRDARLAAGDRLRARLIAAGLGGTTQPAELAALVRAAGAEGPDVRVDAAIQAVHAAGKFFMTVRQYPMVRATLDTADVLLPQEPKKQYACRYVGQVPRSVEGWMVSSLSADAGNRESRFEPYDRRAAELLVYDVNVVRSLAANDAAAGPATSFYMAWDTDGWSLFVECADPDAAKVASGLMGGEQLEMYFAPGLSECYYQWFVGFPGTDFKVVNWNSLHRRFRSLQGRGRADVAMVDGGFGAGIFIPWELVYDKLPADGECWPFNVIRWSRAGGMTWSGKVHNINSFGTVRWDGLTPERLLAIKRKLVMKGFGNYQKAKAEKAAPWNDEVLGDPSFYAQRLLPAIETLDAFGSKVGADMTDTDVEVLFRDALPDWMEFGFKVAELRRDHLAQRILAPTKGARRTSGARPKSRGRSAR